MELKSNRYDYLMSGEVKDETKTKKVPGPLRSNLCPYFLCKSTIRNYISAHAKHLKESKSPTLGPYILYREISSGAFGIVYEGALCCSSFRVAIKKVDMKHKEFSMNMIENEIAILRYVSSSYVTRLYDVFRWKQYVVLVLEYVPGTDLFGFLTDGDNADRILSFEKYEERILLFKKILAATSFLMEHHVFHRDLKLENILLVDDSMFDVKICDFGMARYVVPSPSCSSPNLYGGCGSLHYLPPEFFKKKVYMMEEGTMWALGVIFYALFSERLPFHTTDDFDLAQMILKADYIVPHLGHKFIFPNLEVKQAQQQFFSHLLLSLLHKCPEKRLKMRDIQNHPFLFQINGGQFLTLKMSPQSNLGSPLALTRSQSLNREHIGSSRGADAEQGWIEACYPLRVRRQICLPVILLTILKLVDSRHVLLPARHPLLSFVSFQVCIPHSLQDEIYTQLLENYNVAHNMFAQDILVEHRCASYGNCEEDKVRARSTVDQDSLVETLSAIQAAIDSCSLL